MSAAAIIARVRATGGEISLCEGRIRLRVPQSERDEIAASVKAEKAAIKSALKREAGEAWDAQDYLAYWHERAAVAEYDGGRTRRDAEAIAYECCINEWLDRNPAPSEPGTCAWCGKCEEKNNVLIPLGTHAHAHTWLHPGCWPDWYADQRKKAEAALEDLGIGR